MQHKVTARNAMILKTGGIRFYMDNGRLFIQAPNERYPFPLSGQQTHALLNLLEDHKLDIIGVSIAEQRSEEKRKKEKMGHKKANWVQIDGQWVESVELSELQKEQQDRDDE